MVVLEKIKKKLEKIKDNDQKVIYLERLIKKVNNEELKEQLEELLKEFKLEIPVEEELEIEIKEIQPPQIKIEPFTPTLEERKQESLESKVESEEIKPQARTDYFITETYVTSSSSNRDLFSAIKKDFERRHLVSPSHPEQRIEMLKTLEKYNVNMMEFQKYLTQTPSSNYQSGVNLPPTNVREIINKEEDKKYLRKHK